MTSFTYRSTLPEKMDAPDVPSVAAQRALKELEIINRDLGGHFVLIDAFKKLTEQSENISVVDYGSGGGDNLRAIADWLNYNKRHAVLAGIDINPSMTDFANRLSKSYKNITFHTFNIWDDEVLNLPADFVVNSLFCHHFDDEELVKLLQRMFQHASKAVIINDLVRNRFAYYAIKLITAFYSKSYLVKYDGPLSVARSLTKREWIKILNRAGILNYRIKWMWAWRWQIIIFKHDF